MEIEVIPFTLAGRTPARFETLRTRAPEGHPQQAALLAVADARLRPTLLHSTSWRHADRGVVLTYAAVVDNVTPQRGAEVRPIWRIPLARGTALQPPARIEEDQVAAHALVHLAWLAGHDHAVATALPGAWHAALEAYVAGQPADVVAV